MLRDESSPLSVLRSVKVWAGGVLIGIDQLFNALTFGFPDETFSSRMGRRRKNGDEGAAAACVVLDAIQENHCGMSIEETGTGETDPHHLGHVIHEIPRDPTTRLRKAGLLAMAFVVGQSLGCSPRPVRVPCILPSPSPSPDIPAFEPAIHDQSWPIKADTKENACPNVES